MCYVLPAETDNRSFENYWKAPSDEEEIRSCCLAGTQVKSLCFLGSFPGQILLALAPHPHISKNYQNSHLTSFH